jgi:hypothetical protein
MASWVLVPSLKRLFADFDRIAPGRDHATDGSIGDSAHSSTSDHTPDEISDSLRGKDADSLNEVHAIDVDADLREPGLSMERVVQFLLSRCRSGAEKRLRYIIFNRRIWSASHNWVQEQYYGPSPHTAHAHFSATYTTAHEASTASWHLEDIPVAISDSDVERIGAEVADRLIKITKQSDGVSNTNPVGRAVLDFQGIPDGVTGDKVTAYQVLNNLGRELVKVRQDLAEVKAEVLALKEMTGEDSA